MVPPATPRKYYIVTIRGELGPVDRAAMKDLVRDGEARLDDRVRTATGRPIGTVAEVLSEVRVRDTAELPALVPEKEAPAPPRSDSGRSTASNRSSASGRRSSGRGASTGTDQSRLWLAIAALAVVAVIALAGVVWAVTRTTAPPAPVAAAPTPDSTAPPPSPATTANPVVAYDSPLHPIPGPAADTPPPPVSGNASPGDASSGIPGPAAALSLSVVRDVMLWDGDAYAGGHGWFWPTVAPNNIDTQDQIAHSGRHALCFHGEGTGNINAGWGWDTSTKNVDFTQLHAVVLSFKMVGPALPASILLVLEGDGKQSRYAALADYCPTFADGQWHDIVVPFSALADANADLAIYSQFQINTVAPGALHFDIYVDDVGYTKEEPGKP